MGRKRTLLLVGIVIAGLLAGCYPVGTTTPVGGPVTPVPPDHLAEGPQRPDTLTVLAAGDLFVPPPLTEQAARDAASAGRQGHDFTAILAAVAPEIRDADLAICHLEQPLAEPDGPFPSYPFFAAPPQLADAIAGAGFDTCSTASNHVLDSGMEGVVRTLDNLDRVGVAHTGSARSEREADTPTVVDVNGVGVGHLSYTFSFNGIPLPDNSPWAANLINADAILHEARRARLYGAEIVIASLHWGTEYQVEADAGQVALANELLAGPDIDLIIGHHVHVVQPFEKIGEKWVAYGLGNLTTRFPDGSPENTRDSVLPRFTFTEIEPERWQVTDVEVVGAWMEYRPRARVVNLPAALGSADLPDERRAGYARSLARITGYVLGRGADSDGLRMVEPAGAAPDGNRADARSGVGYTCRVLLCEG